MLTLKDVRHIFEEQRGIALESISFSTVTTNPNAALPKSLFIPMSFDHEKNVKDLGLALNNGSVGTLWKKNDPVPGYLPTHFPVFFVESYGDALTKVVNYYIETYSMKGNETVHTKFLLPITCIHSEFYSKEIEDTLYNLSTIMKKEIPNLLIEEKGGEEQC
ncbi:hypothetical protein [Bacillus suaedaesalsae]|uniref:AraC family transcriptional regulator n=1 Tax=Bacillus suaedaesalsae TaxID=2810349 RepID=A0ABS2DJ76_9BACI|nr:hypothetical protein [Bacillus suaedaesalsae]MBM6618549.1 hypothetical protein [Bacillus suaedaesalsae]